ncbi:hypothetical protein HDU96_007685 [Phlyctochytrium bullatum]|nr:hypothetical protein HDU96_007685 [Phlyctochytrium bullatum]
MPMLGLCTLPNEVLRTVLLDVKPNDLIAIASVNRHLRHAVPACIDYGLAKRHLAAAGCFETHKSSKDIPYFTRWIRFRHRLLFEHSVALFSLYGISNKVAEWIWGEDWKPIARDEKTEEIRCHRLNVVRTVLKKWSSVPRDSAPEPFVLTLDKANVKDAFEMAGFLRSMELFDQLRSLFPTAINNNPRSVALRQFILASAKTGFCDGLELISKNHPMLDRHGCAMLRLAVQSQHIETVQNLLEKGAPLEPTPGESCPTSHPPLLSALNDNTIEILRLLLQRGADPNGYRGYRTPLSEAAERGQIQVLKLLLEFGVDVKKDKAYSLHAAASSKTSDGLGCVVALLDAGADVNATNSSHITALFEACKTGSAAKVKILLDRGASVDPPKAPHSPLHEVLQLDTARDADVINIVKILVQNGAQKNSRNKSGETPLHVAVQKGHTAAAMLLLELGADPSVKCGRCKTPVQLLPQAATTDRSPDAWRRRRKVPWSPMWLELLARFVEKGADLKAKSKHGETVWQELCKAGLKDRALLQWLLGQEGFEEDMRRSFLVVWDRMFAKLDD